MAVYISLVYFLKFLECIAGTEGNGLVCTQCLKSYHPGGQPGNVTCIRCPDNTFAPDGSTSADNCEGKSVNMSTSQCRIQDFLGGINSQVGAPRYYFAHENERVWTEWGTRSWRPIGSATAADGYILYFIIHF